MLIDSFHLLVLRNQLEEIKIKEGKKKISFERKRFNLLENFEKKLILKSKCESLSHSIFIESKHIDIILKKCLSKKNNFRLNNK